MNIQIYSNVFELYIPNSLFRLATGNAFIRSHNLLEEIEGPNNSIAENLIFGFILPYFEVLPLYI